MTFISAEPFLGHFGLGGVGDSAKQVARFLDHLGIEGIPNAVIKEVRDGEIELEGGRVLPFAYSMIVPPFAGVDAVRDSEGLSNPMGFVPIDARFRHPDHPDVYSAGVATAIAPPEPTEVPAGVPKTGQMSETMAKVAAQNIVADLKARQPPRHAAGATCRRSACSTRATTGSSSRPTTCSRTACTPTATSRRRASWPGRRRTGPSSPSSATSWPAASAASWPSDPLGPMLLAAVLGLVIGLVVGMVGGGGAVLAVPALVYGVGLGVQEATTASLAVVASAALTGAIAQSRRGAVCWSSALWFASAAALGSVAGTAANDALGGAVLLLAFSAVMLAAARATWQRAGAPAAASTGCPRARVRLLIPAGLAVGALTGLVGVGGGFVIVPALAIGLSFGMREAMGTSMVIVAIVSVFGLGAHLAAGLTLDVPIAMAMGAAALLGALAGPRLADRVPTQALGRGFAGLVVVIAVGVAAATLAGASV